MDKVQWREGFSTGVEFLDKASRNLLDLINEMIEIQNSDEKDSQLLSSLLSQIQDFALMHFVLEERFLMKLHQNDFSDHKAQHTLFKKKLAFFCFELSDKPQEASLDEFCEFLADWFEQHCVSSRESIIQFCNHRAL